MKKGKKKKAESRRRGSTSQQSSSDSGPQQQPSSNYPLQQQPSSGSTPQQQPSSGSTPKQQASSGSNPQQPESQALAVPEVRRSAQGLLPQNTGTKASPGSRKTDDLEESTQVIVIHVLQALGTAAVALGALGAAFHIIESL